MEDDLIDGYLDDLLRELQVEARRARRILAETEDHLRALAEQERAAGLPSPDAEERALARFGSPALVARRFAREDGPAMRPALLLNFVLSLALVAGIGLAAIGASGLLAAGMGAAFGKSFVAADVSGVTYTPARCADFLEYEPGASDCDAAATAHHFGEVVEYRVAAGVLGLLALAGYAVLRRRFRRAGARLLPRGFVATVGAALFGVAGLALLGQGMGQLVFDGGRGAGALLSGGIVSAGVFAVYAAMLLRAVTVRPVLS